MKIITKGREPIKSKKGVCGECKIELEYNFKVIYCNEKYKVIVCPVCWEELVLKE